MEERAHTHNLTSQLKVLENDQQKEPTPSKGREEPTFRAETSKLESQNNPKDQWDNELLFLINTINEAVARHTKKEKEP